MSEKIGFRRAITLANANSDKQGQDHKILSANSEYLWVILPKFSYKTTLARFAAILRTK